MNPLWQSAHIQADVRGPLLSHRIVAGNWGCQPERGPKEEGGTSLPTLTVSLPPVLKAAKSSRMALWMLDEDALPHTQKVDMVRFQHGGVEVTVGRTFTLAFRLEWSHHGPDGTDTTGETLDVSFDVAK